MQQHATGRVIQRATLTLGTVSLLGLMWTAACDPEPDGKPAPIAVSSSVRSDNSAEPNAAASAQGGGGAELHRGKPCGALDCREFPNAAEALTALLNLEPEIIAFGEAHALKGKDEHVLTATERFETELLPLLAKSGASELVVELLKPNNGCKKAVETTRTEQRVVTEKQAPKNQNRFVSLGHAARRLKVVPHLLTPSCSDFEKIAKAGDDAIPKLLELISSQSERRLQQLWRKHETQKRRLVLAYGGAMHNDIIPPVPAGEQAPVRAAFSFGSALVRQTQGRYLAVDLIVPEFVSDTEVWRALPWYRHFDRSKSRTQATLFRLDDASFVILFPDSVPPKAKGPKAKEE